LVTRIAPGDLLNEAALHGKHGSHFDMTIDYLVGAGVLLATAATDAAYVMFTASVVARRPLAAANWSGVWYMLSSFAVISYTNNWIYVGFAIVGSWIGAYLTLKYFHREPSHQPAPLKPSA
jgi:uncharacterized membrane protein YhaH (DUF805 family)